MKDISLIDEINPTLIALTKTAIHHCPLAWKPGECRVEREFGPGGGAQHSCDTSNINHAVNDACRDEFHCLNVDLRSFLPEVQTRKIDNICSVMHRRIHSTGTDPAMAQHPNDQGSFDEDMLDYVSEELIGQPDICLIPLSSFVAATEASMQFSAVLPIGRSAIARSSQLFPFSDSNSNSNDITSVANMNSIENTGLLDGCTILEDAMSPGG